MVDWEEEWGGMTLGQALSTQLIILPVYFSLLDWNKGVRLQEAV